MNIIILLSDAPGFCNFLPYVGYQLEKHGNRVIYIADSSHVYFIAKKYHPKIKIERLDLFTNKILNNEFEINRGAFADWERIECIIKGGGRIKNRFIKNLN